MLTEFTVETPGAGLTEITQLVGKWLKGQGDGLLTLMIRHSSASLLVQENADPDVRRDLMVWLDRLVPAADQPDMGWITHRSEGPDDMPAHLRAAHLPVSLSLPVAQGAMMLGTWQGIFVVEHRAHPHTRRIAAQFLAD